ncbi:MAG: agmatinase [Desulfovibrio sp.]|jgi:agmatinase|nr:agmatinase [Desulfovibrio sp.]MBQ2476826.1 agmatinase [Desulfovibrio sp.]
MACTRFLESEYPQEKPELAGFHIIPVPLERTVSYGAGARLGPQAILDASFQLEDWDGTSRPGELGFHTQAPVDCEGSVEAVLERIAERVRQALAWGACPVVLGGEHTVTYGPVTALCEQDRDFGIVHVDAHCDLRAEYEGDPFSHACVLRRIEDDFGLPLAQFATRDYCREERDYRESRGILHWDAATLARGGLPAMPLPASFPRRLYVTFDVDGFDSSLMPATGTPSPGGLFWHDALRLLEACAAEREIIGFDVVELAPIQGLHHADFTAAKLVHALMGLAQRSMRL